MAGPILPLRRVGYGAKKAAVIAPSTALDFGRSAATSGYPAFTAATLADSDFTWYRVDNLTSRVTQSQFTGKAPAGGNFPIGSYAVTCTDWSAVTEFNFGGCRLNNLDPTKIFASCTGLTNFDINDNSLSSVSAASWSWPSSLQTIRADYSYLTGSVASWTLPTSLVTLNLEYCTDITGSVAGWTLPAGLVTLKLRGTAVSGSVAGWSLPSTLQTLNLFGCGSLTGSVAGWSFPSGLTTLQLYNCYGLTGDVSGWSLPSGLTTIVLNNCHSLSGSLSGWTLPTSATGTIDLSWLYGNSADVSGWVLPSGCTTLDVSDWVTDYGTGGMLQGVRSGSGTYNLSNTNGSYGDLTTADVDRALADCVASNKNSNTLRLQGSRNGIPTDGASNADYLHLTGTHSWTVSIRTS